MAGETTGPDAEAALSDLCRGYWTPIYSFARRAGHSREDAEDLTQGFFLDLLARNSIAGAVQERGRFRSFLLGAFEHYRFNCFRKESTQKRGGGVELFSMDAGPAEAGLAMEAATTGTPETMYERTWALALLAKVMERLKAEYEAVYPHLAGESSRPGYAGMAAVLGISENAIPLAVRRMRKRYGILLREEIAATVVSEAEVDDELRYLMKVIRGD